MADIPRRTMLTAGAGAIGGAVANSVILGAAASDPRVAQVHAAATAAAVDSVILLATPEQFPGIDPAGQSDSTVGLQAAVDATPDGGTLVVPAGRYLVAGPIAPKSGKSITVSGYSAIFVATAGKSTFSLRGEYGPTVAIQRVENRARAFSSGASAEVSVLVAAATVPWKQGDVLKLVADDEIPGARPGGRRIGEFVVVSAVEGNDVILGGRVRESYRSNIRAARISDQTIALLGLVVETADARMSSVNEALLSFSRLSNPHLIDVRCTRAGGQVMRFSSCFGYTVKDVRVDYARDEPANGVYGYGVLDNSSSFGLIDGGVFSHCRHAYTDDTVTTTPGSADLAPYGRTYGTVLTNVHALMSSAAAFSMHHASEGVAFLSCTASGGAPSGGAAAGWELRGFSHRVSACSATNLTDGVLIRTESTGGESRLHTVTDLAVSGLSGAAVRLEIHPAGHPAQNIRDTEMNAWIDGLRAHNSARLLYSENSTISVRNAHYGAPAGAAGVPIESIFTRNSDFRIDGMVLDFTSNLAGLPRPFITGSTSGRTPGRQDTDLRNVDIRITEEAASRSYFAFGGTENVILARGLRFTVPFPSMPGQSHPDTSWQWYAEPRAGLARADLSSAHFTYKSTDLKNVLTEVLKSSDSRVFININAENKNLTVEELPAGRRRGQEWVFTQYTAGQTTFKHGDSARTSLKSGVNRVLWKGRRLELVWDGAIWQEFVSLSIT